MTDTTTTTQEQQENKTFQEKVTTFLDSFEIQDKPEGQKWPNYRFKKGVTKERMAENLGYKNVNSANQGITAIRKFLQYLSMEVEYNGEKMTGEELQQKTGKRGRKAFLDYCDEQLASDTPAFKVLTPGVKFPNFPRSRSAQDVPSLSTLMGKLKGQAE